MRSDGRERYPHKGVPLNLIAGSLKSGAERHTPSLSPSLSLVHHGKLTCPALHFFHSPAFNIQRCLDFNFYLACLLVDRRPSLLRSNLYTNLLKTESRIPRWLKNLSL